MKILRFWTVCGLLAFSAVSHAGITMNAKLATEYMFRGITQTDNNPAAQAGIKADINFLGVLFYASLWGSNVDFQHLGRPIGGPTGKRNQPTVEIEYKFGADFTAFGLGWEVGALYNTYEGDTSSLDYAEIFFGLNYDFGVAKVSGIVNFTPDYWDSTDETYYWEGAVDVPIPANFLLTVHAGYLSLTEEDRYFFGAADPQDSYIDYSIGVSRPVLGFDVDLTYSDTDLSKSECFGGQDACDARFILSIGKEM